uniref:Plasmatocyte-spreading peptide n=1 Tax=Chrysodeixis includens TaxID=689277 RepID=PSP1_CHRIL|nr:RecName: Full=Plasmatocyte-spreading peptide; Flags: Precursor [Chrysodeixis includens]AAC16546.1 plasmatocyte-spreading peptide precursor [Chrysodeixis includens]
MKLTINILFCLILISQYNSANGNLRDLFNNVRGSISSSANKIRQDVKTLFHPSDKSGNKESSNIVFVEDKDEGAVGPARDNKPVAVTPAPVVSTTTQASAPTVATNGTATGGKDDKGRENFNGGCLAGYMRTADGRCKPTF